MCYKKVERNESFYKHSNTRKKKCSVLFRSEKKRQFIFSNKILANKYLEQCHDVSNQILLVLLFVSNLIEKKDNINFF